MSVGSRDSYLKSLPAVGPFLDRVARYRMKGFHREERNGDGNELDVVATYPVFPPWSPGTPKWLRDATANDSDKSFTVPAGKAWKLNSIEAALVCTATVGTRLCGGEIFDASGNAIARSSYVAPTASQSGILRWVAGGVSNTTGWRTLIGANGTDANAAVRDTLPDTVILTAGFVVRVRDYAAIDAAADDLTVVMHYVEYDA